MCKSNRTSERVWTSASLTVKSSCQDFPYVNQSIIAILGWLANVILKSSLKWKRSWKLFRHVCFKALCSCTNRWWQHSKTSSLHVIVFRTHLWRMATESSDWRLIGRCESRGGFAPIGVECAGHFVTESASQERLGDYANDTEICGNGSLFRYLYMESALKISMSAVSKSVSMAEQHNSDDATRIRKTSDNGNTYIIPRHQIIDHFSFL